MVEHLIRNEGVAGSSPVAGTIYLLTNYIHVLLWSHNKQGADMLTNTNINDQSFMNISSILDVNRTDHVTAMKMESLSLNTGSLKGHLDLGFFKSLKSLYLFNPELPFYNHNMCLTSIDFSNNQNLKGVYFGDNSAPNLQRITLSHPYQIEQICVNNNKNILSVYKLARDEAFARIVVNTPSEKLTPKAKEIMNRWNSIKNYYFDKQEGKYLDYLILKFCKETGQNVFE